MLWQRLREGKGGARGMLQKILEDPLGLHRAVVERNRAPFMASGIQRHLDRLTIGSSHKRQQILELGLRRHVFSDLDTELWVVTANGTGKYVENNLTIYRREEIFDVYFYEHGKFVRGCRV